MIIKTMVTYAWLVWSSDMQQPYVQVKFQQMQRLVCLEITGANSFRDNAESYSIAYVGDEGSSIGCL